MCAAEHGHLDIVKYLLAQPDCDSTKVDVVSSRQERDYMNIF